MPDLIVIRLHPVEPTTAEKFTNYLSELTITAVEFSFDNLAGDDIGSAAYLSLPDPGEPQNPDPDTRIVQHVVQEPDDFGIPELVLKVVATAVIDAQSPAGEYGTFDIKLRIERAGGTIIHQQVYYNIPVVSGDLPSPADFPNLDASLHLALPPPQQQLDPEGQAFVDLPEDGSPPNFSELFSAVLKVLDAEPQDAPALGEFAPRQCRHIASEISWNRDLFPLPDRPTRTGFPPPEPPPPNAIEDMYTGPHEDDDAIEQERRKFEAELLSYYALHNAQALRLEGFVCAMSAAIFAEDQSRKGTRVRFEVPTLLNDDVTRGKIKQAEIALTASGAIMDPSFMVPAEVFYALGAIMPSAVPAEQRYQMAVLQDEPRVLEELQRAIDSGVVTPVQTSDEEPPRINELTLPQITRRLHALGGDRWYRLFL